MRKSSLSRRKLIKIMGSGVFLPTGMLGVSSSVLSDASARPETGKKIVLLELAGANDGLNTLIPFKDHRYAELRPKLGLARPELIEIDGEFALHNALRKLLPLWENGEIALLHGLGYPHANRSHFKSMAIWETGGDGLVNGRRGWMTHDIEHAYAARQVDAHGISLGGGMGIFTSPTGNWISMNSVNQLLGRSDLVASNQARRQQNPEYASTDNPALSLILGRTESLTSSLQSISHKIEKIPQRTRLKGSSLAKQLSHAANLINAGVDSPVIKVSHGGFDTHENQAGRHRQLLSQFADAVSGFRHELVDSGEWNNTLLVTYSEFGRRARENRSGGTDHGTAAPHFVMGGSVQGGLWGNSPDLGELIEDDLQYTMDYRALYSELLSGWLGLPRDHYAEHADNRLKNLLKVS